MRPVLGALEGGCRRTPHASVGRWRGGSGVKTSARAGGREARWKSRQFLATTGRPSPAAPQGPGGEGSAKGLKSGSLNLFSSVVIAVASVAPAYSLAATLGLLAAVVGLRSPFIMIVSFVPMLLVVGGLLLHEQGRPRLRPVVHLVGTGLRSAARLGHRLRRHRRVDDRHGQPRADRLAVHARVPQPAHPGRTRPSGSTFFGVLWLVGIGVIVAIGIEVSARTQYILMGVQMISMFVFAAWALIKAYTVHPSFAYPAHNPPDPAQRPRLPHVVQLASVELDADHPGHRARHLPLLGLGHRDERQRGVEGLARPAGRLGGAEHHPARLHLRVRHGRLPGVPWARASRHQLDRRLHAAGARRRWPVDLPVRSSSDSS